MVRTQIQLTDSQARMLKRLAVEQGVSMAELIRQSIENFLRAKGPLDDQAQRRRALDAAGRFRSGLHDLATAHDRYLEDAYRS